MQKLSFTGDILCSDVHDKICRTETGYDYTPLFSRVSDFLRESDFVVANLETTLSGAERGYTHEPASFNTPGAFADALKAAGVDFVTLANNHILDRGLDGMFHTIEVLKRAGLERDCRRVLKRFFALRRILRLSARNTSSEKFRV